MTLKLMKLKLLIVALVLLVANSAFATLALDATYNVSINTASLSGQQGYLYFSYIPANSAVDSFAMVSGYAGGTLAGSNSSTVLDGSAVYGQLPNNVSFYNTNGNNDYNHGITFGNSINFSLALSRLATGGQAGDSSTFSFGLFRDVDGLTPLVTTDGTLFTVSLFNDGTTSAGILASEADVTPTPIPAAFWLLGSGLAGLAGIRRRS